MRRWMKMLLIVCPALVVGPLQAEDDQAVGVVESERNAVEGFFYSVWSRLSALSPRSGSAEVRQGVIATAGLRGADDDNLEMEPYWKGDLSQDVKFQQQIEAYRDAIERGREGDRQALETFLDRHGDSDLAANVHFALALSQARSGEREAARRGLERFVERYPGHPLVVDAEALLHRFES